MNALGKHLLLELRDCKNDILNDINAVKSALVAAATEAGASIVGVSFHRFNPHGISGMVIIAESHLSVHTWPEYRFAAVDIFTCGDSLKPDQAAAYLIQAFDSHSPSVMELKRGLLGAGDGELPHKVGGDQGSPQVRCSLS
ncbi:MAG: adenosylmethionine decarboxylase [Deltaproteobacteria bacterium]|nr:adenosylmethionine decarboxylase [Deltaproteobacteria bacterium]MBI3079519.1 adenosylmethionine decarboxylase [Deltaproteobacteria bacterium]